MSNLPASVSQKIVSLIAAELSVQPRQVAAAVDLLDEGATVPFIARYRKEATGNLDDTQLVAAELNKIGIRTTLKALEGASAFKAYAEGNFTLIGAQINTPSLNEPSSLFDLLYHSTGARNYGRFKDAKMDRLIEQARREPDVAKRRAIYHELQRYILTEEPGGGVIVGAPYGYFLRDRRVRNLVLAPNLYSNNTFMKVWLDE